MPSGRPDPAPPLTAPQLRLVLAISLDGRLAPAGGGAAQIGGRGDRRVLEDALAWADGCLIGAGTLRAHGTTCLLRRSELLAERLRAGRPPQPTAVVVSRGGPIDPALPFFRQPLRRWLLCSAAESPAPAGFERRLLLENWRPSLQQLASAGLERLVLLGGAELVSTLLASDLVEELQLSLCPTVLGGAHTWVGTRSPDLSAARWALSEQRGLGGGELQLRYRRQRNEP